MNIAIAQLNYHIGNFEKNTEKIISAIQRAKQNKVDLIVFSELCVCGYPPMDLLQQSDFIEKCNESAYTIAQECDGIAAIIGCPTINNNDNEKPLYNSALFLHNKRITNVFHKTLLPSYDIYDEQRYFEQNKTFELLEFKAKKLQ
ncbi:MAG TPA: nitrilase-related carbon-nitrogen hydrolase [Bacteroidales bacterium]|nr:nitrilase-related carbon-nitrogen hydrolase [Bacteroidales bacterium]